MDTEQTVFVVDDEEPVRKAVRLIAERAGHTVEVFASARDFLDAYGPARAGCLILDVRMPGMDGMELLRHLQKEDAPIPIIMLTAHGDVPMAVDAMKTGAVEFLEKPADPAVLREKIAAALERDANWRLDEEERQEIRDCYEQLTAREREVAELLVDGKSCKIIGTILGTSESTVRVQRGSILKKMRADNVPDVIRMINTLHG